MLFFIRVLKSMITVMKIAYVEVGRNQTFHLWYKKGPRHFLTNVLNVNVKNVINEGIYRMSVISKI